MNKNALTENDKKRIEAEEKYRAKVRKGLSEAPKQKPKGCGKGCLTLIIVFIVLGTIGSIIPPLLIKMAGKSTPPPVTQRDFKASVKFTGTQFVITNLDNLDCQNAEMKVNSDYIYGEREYTLYSGDTYEVEAYQFAKSDGTQFNPEFKDIFEIKPKNYYILCRGNNALAGISYAVEFN